MAALSQLPNLEPILGCAFTLNLAYIGLERFRYRRKIRENATQKLGDLAKDAPRNCSDTILYKSVIRLSSLENDRKIFSRSNQNDDLSGAWSFIYENFFECHQDRILAIFNAFCSAILLSLGVAHNIGLSVAENTFNQNWIGIWFMFVNWLMIAPVASVIAGRAAVSGANTFAGKQISDLKKIMQTKVSEATVPPLPDLPSPPHSLEI